MLVEGFALHTFASVVDILSAANNVLGTTAYTWEVLSEGDLEVKSSSGISIRADRCVEDDIGNRSQIEVGTVFLCGSRSNEEAFRKSTKGWIRSEVRHGAKIAAFDSGAFILASAGLLADQQCTLHWASIPHFTEKFGVETDVVTNIYVDNGKVATCAGGAAASDLAINIIASHHGASVANRVAEISVMDRVRGPCDRQRLPFQSRFGQLNRRLAQAIGLMMDTGDQTIGLDDIASKVSLSRRQLERLFRQEFEITPAKYYMLMRLERAHLLLCDTNLPVVEVATACGFRCVGPFHAGAVFDHRFGAAEGNRLPDDRDARGDQLCGCLATLEAE